MAYTPQTFFKGAKTMVAKTPAMAVQLAYDGWTLSGPAPAPPRSQQTASLADIDGLSSTYVRFEDENGNPFPGKHVVIKVDSATGDILDIISEV